MRQLSTSRLASSGLSIALVTVEAEILWACSLPSHQHASSGGFCGCVCQRPQGRAAVMLTKAWAC